MKRFITKFEFKELDEVHGQILRSFEELGEGENGIEQIWFSSGGRFYLISEKTEYKKAMNQTHYAKNKTTEKINPGHGTPTCA